MVNKITLVAVFYNEAEKLPGYFKNVSGVVDEMVVVDCNSTDGTAKICKANGAKVIKSNIRYFEQNINKALSAAQTEWLLIVSADERLSTRLKKEIRGAVRHAEGTDIFAFKRINYLYEGFSTKSGINRFEPRLFRKGHVYWANETPHEPETVVGKVKRLGGLMYHYSIVSIGAFLEKTYDYVCKLPSEFAKRGKVATFGERDRRVSLIFGTHGLRMLFLFPIFRTLDNLVRQRLILDGMRGLVHSILAGVHAFLEEASYWEISSKKRQGAVLDWKKEYPDGRR